MDIISKVFDKFLRLTLVLVMLFSIYFIGKSEISLAQEKGTIRIGLSGEIDPLSPNDTTSMNTEAVIPHIFEQLVLADMNMNIHPQLATSWEVNQDGDLVFQLRKGVKFHDGTTFDANAVKATFDRIMGENLKRKRMFASFLKSVEVLGDYSVKMDIDGPPNLALTVLGIRGHIESPNAIRKHGKDIGLHPIGTGPFKFVEWVTDQHVILEANEGYWRGAPEIKKVIFKPVRDVQTRLAMVEAGDLDVAIRPPITEIERLKKDKNLNIIERKSATIFYVKFNTVNYPLDDYQVRQAICYAIDRKGIVKALLFGIAKISNSWIGPMIKHALEYDIYPYDPEKAKRMLGDLGWKPGSKGLLEKDGKVFRTGIVTPSGRYPMDRQIAEAVQAQLKKIGIEVKVITVDSAAFIKALYGNVEAKKSADFGMMIVIRPMGPEPDSAFSQHYHSKSMPPKGSNYCMYKNEEVDTLIMKGGKEKDEAKRATIYKNIQDIIYKEVPDLPVYIVPGYSVVRKGLKGVGYRHAITPITVQPEARWE